MDILNIKYIKDIMEYLGEDLVCIFYTGTSSKVLNCLNIPDKSDIDIIFLVNNEKKLKLLKNNRSHGFELYVDNKKVDIIFNGIDEIFSFGNFTKSLGNLEKLFLEREDFLFINKNYSKFIDNIISINNKFPYLKKSMLFYILKEYFYNLGDYSDNVIVKNGISVFKLRIDKILESDIISKNFFTMIDFNTRKPIENDNHLWKRLPMLVYMYSKTIPEYNLNISLIDFRKYLLNNDILESDLSNFVKCFCVEVKSFIDNNSFDSFLYLKKFYEYLEELYEKNI